MGAEIYNHLGEAYYKIIVDGEMQEDIQSYFEGMTIKTEKNKFGKKSTILSGNLKDQSALIGLLNMLYNFQYSISSVKLAKKKEKQTDIP